MFQRRVHVDQPAGGRGGAGRIRAGGPGPGPPGDQRGAGGALPDRRRGGRGRHQRHSHQLPRREAAHALTRRLPGRPAGPHLCGLQHVAPPGGRNEKKTQVQSSEAVHLIRPGFCLSGGPRCVSVEVCRDEKSVQFGAQLLT